MAPSDLVTAVPGVVVVGLMPGFALATAIVPRWPWWYRLAAAPGLAAGLCGVLGLLEHDAGIPYEPATVLPVLAVVAIVALVIVVRTRRRTLLPPEGLRSGPSGWRAVAVVVAALAAGGCSAGAAAAALDGTAFPLATDTPAHATVAERIATEHDVLAPVPVPALHSATVRPRTGFESTAASASWLGGPRPTRMLLPLVLLAVVLLPLSIAALAWETTGSWAVAALTPLLGVGMQFPRFPVILGEFPLVTDSTLVLPLILVSIAAVRGAPLRRAALLAGAATASVWVVHGLEAITAAVVGGPLALSLIITRGRDGWRRLLVSVGVGALVGALAVTVLTRLPVVPPEQIPAGVTFSAQGGAPAFLGLLGTTRDTPEVINVIRSSVLLTPLALWLYLGGIVAALLRRRLRWALVAHLLLVGCLADAQYGHHLARLWNAVFPWATLDRLLSMHWWVLPMLMAFGVVSGFEWLVRSAGSRSRARTSVSAGVAIAAVTAVTVVAGTRDDHGVFQQAVAVHEVGTQADAEALAAMDRLLPPGAVVLTNSEVDAGMWVGAFTRDIEYAPGSYVRQIADARGLPLGNDPRVIAIARACTDPTSAAAALNGVRALFVGSSARTDATIHWDAGCIARLPGVKVAAVEGSGSTTARVFLVEPPASTG